VDIVFYDRPLDPANRLPIPLSRAPGMVGGRSAGQGFRFRFRLQQWFAVFGGSGRLCRGLPGMTMDRFGASYSAWTGAAELFRLVYAVRAVQADSAPARSVSPAPEILRSVPAPLVFTGRGCPGPRRSDGRRETPRAVPSGVSPAFRKPEGATNVRRMATNQPLWNILGPDTHGAVQDPQRPAIVNFCAVNVLTCLPPRLF
jgi:hypothetical protein